MATYHLLHLSDIHLGKTDDAATYLSQLKTDLIQELDVNQLDYLVISGDIANRSTKDEYLAAVELVQGLIKHFHIGLQHLIVVPGNHDLNWDFSEDAYEFTPKRKIPNDINEAKMIPAGDIGALIRNEEKYRRRFSNFSEYFYKPIYNTAYPETYDDQAILWEDSDHRILFLGLNSCWELDHHNTSRSGIHTGSLNRALDSFMGKKYDGWLKCVVYHHPVAGTEMMKNVEFMERLSVHRFQVVLHGHIHEAIEGYHKYDSIRGLHVIGAGTFGAPVREMAPGIPLQYNLIQYDAEAQKITVKSRKREKRLGAWGADARWGNKNDPKPQYVIDLKTGNRTDNNDSTLPNIKTEPVPIQAAPSVDLESEIRLYREKAESIHEKLPLIGFKTNLRVPILIEEIYVPLRAIVDLRPTGCCEFADSEDAEKKLHDANEEISVPDAFKVCETMNRRGIVILGDPGSGKTTHLKRLLLWSLKGECRQMSLPDNMLPVFLPLRELNDVKQGLDTFIQNQLDHPHLETKEGFGRRLLDRRNLLFLFDGLDEVADPDHRKKVTQWINKALTSYASCRFVVSCRFAGYTKDSRLSADFLEMHMRPMNADQAADFIHNWYRIVETGTRTDKSQAAIIAKERADDLVKRLEQPEFRARRVFELTRNPLLLTNICLVHHSRGNLPYTRAQLYEECTDVLLELWRGSIGYESRISSKSGRRVLQPAALWLHQKEKRTRATADELSPIIEKPLKAVGWTHGTAKDFLKAVRDESGILTGWGQEQYGFMHLGFQEYLAAREIKSRAFTHPGILKTLAKAFGNSWWQEVMLLMLALEEPSLFEPFMREVVKLPAFVNHSDVVEMCLDDAAEKTPQPFIELMEKEPGKDRSLWERQLVALRILERMDETVIEMLSTNLKNHPYEPIRKRFQDRKVQETQTVIQAPIGGYELVWIPGGTFMMGSNEYDREKPVHPVTLSGFYMGRYPVTNEEYARYLQAYPKAKEPEYWSNRKYNQPRQPVVGVNWNEATEYAAWAGLKLPTEAQWEYACRAGTQTKYYTGDSEKDLDRAGWYKENSGLNLHPVGEKEPNVFGLYDMHGNIWEWCQDWYGKYPSDASVDPEGPRTGSLRVDRGGSWDGGAAYCRSACRGWSDPSYRDSRLGFRLVLPGQQNQ